MNLEYPAFPDGVGESEGISILEYFAASAPHEPQSWFRPNMPPRPKSEVPIDPIPNDGETITEEEIRTAQNWRHDPCWDLENPKLSYWIAGVKKHWEQMCEWNKKESIAIYAQWPWAWAKAVLEAKEAAKKPPEEK